MTFLKVRGKFLSFALVFLFAAPLCFCASAGTVEDADGIVFGAICSSAEEVKTAVECGAGFIAAEGDYTLAQAFEDAGELPVVIDVYSADQAEKYVKEFAVEVLRGRVYLKAHFPAKEAEAWAKGKEKIVPGIICTYSGNVYFSAVSAVKTASHNVFSNICLLSSGNPYGVITHGTVTGHFQTMGVRGMFSFADKAKAAGREDNLRSWDDLVTRGYSVIETRCPEDFRKYLDAVDLERAELEKSLEAAESVSTEGCHVNRIKALDKAVLQAKEALLLPTASLEKLSEARLAADEAVRNLTVFDKQILKGEFAVTPARLGGAVFGVGLVIFLQVFFRSRWGKKDD